jgi:hypothetical protein
MKRDPQHRCTTIAVANSIPLKLIHLTGLSNYAIMN